MHEACFHHKGKTFFFIAPEWIRWAGVTLHRASQCSRGMLGRQCVSPRQVHPSGAICGSVGRVSTIPKLVASGKTAESKTFWFWGVENANRLADLWNVLFFFLPVTDSLPRTGRHCRLRTVRWKFLLRNGRSDRDRGPSGFRCIFPVEAFSTSIMTLASCSRCTTGAARIVWAACSARAVPAAATSS